VVGTWGAAGAADGAGAAGVWAGAVLAGVDGHSPAAAAAAGEGFGCVEVNKRWITLAQKKIPPYL
jgi:hypothetical protein